MSNDMELRRKKIETYTKWGLGALGALVISPVIFMIVKGIIGLAIAGAVGLAVITFAPVVAMKFANWKLRAVKAEASANPIETLQNVFKEKMDALRRFSESITVFHAEVANFADKVKLFEKQYPADAGKFAEQLEKMRELLKLRQNNYKQAQGELALFESEIQRASAIWDMANAAAAMNKAAGMNEDDILEKIKTETAVDSVQKNLNRAFAELETSLIEEPVATAEQLNSLTPAPRGQMRKVTE